MTTQTIWNSTIFPVVGLSVTFAITLMTMGLLDLPADIGWAAIFLIPVVGFAMLLHRNHRGAVVNQRAITSLVLMMVLAGIIVPRIEWEGTAIMGLAGLSLVLGVLTGVLSHTSYTVTKRTDTEFSV